MSPGRTTGRAEGPAIQPDLNIEADVWETLPDLDALVGRALVAGLAEAPFQPMSGAELNILLTDDARIRAINLEWRGFDKPTNVLSFPAANPDRIAKSPVLGDLVLAHETIAREAEADGKTFPDHLSHLLIHGLLHLLGEDHETEAQAEAMEAREIAALARLGIADPYAGLELEAQEGDTSANQQQERPSAA
ncbi:MAG: rRNA maturation RNase YbeY [Bosea sp. (in: a-proteobacteria)]